MPYAPIRNYRLTFVSYGKMWNETILIYCASYLRQEKHLNDTNAGNYYCRFFYCSKGWIGSTGNEPRVRIREHRLLWIEISCNIVLL